MKKNILLISLIIVANLFLGSSIGGEGGEGTTGNVTILENGSYFNGKVFVPFGEMILKEGKILSIQSEVSKQPGLRIPLNGKYVIPGLIDAHVHITGSPAFPYVVTDPMLNANSSLLCGVTTLIDLFYPESTFKDAREKAARQPAAYATLLMAGPILTAPGGHGTEYGVPTRTITSVEEAKKITNEVIDGGVDVIKLVYEDAPEKYIPSINKDMVKAIVEAAHRRNKKVFAHIDRAAQAVDCAEAGADVLAHMPADSLTGDQLKKLKVSGIVIVPTITVLQSALEGLDAKYMSDTLLWATANPDYLDNFTHGKIPAPPQERMRKFFPASKFHENLANCIKAKIPILAGTDAGNHAVFYGYSLHNELLQYTLSGMTNAEALCSATQNISLVFPGIKTGKIIPGYDADLVVLNADPLKNIENTKSISMVFHKGEQVKDLIADVKKTNKTKADTPPGIYDPKVFDIANKKPLPRYIYALSDSSMGGNSWMSAQLQKDGSGTNYIHLDGKIVKKGYLGFASLGFTLSMQNDNAPVDISGFSAVTFDARGNGETYHLVFISSLVKDYNFHGAPFTATKDWKTIKIPVSDLKQSPYYGKAIPLDLKTIQVVSFTATGKDYDINLDIKNIQLVK
jgi:imidazolonepropionase-like amidohydrolase